MAALKSKTRTDFICRVRYRNTLPSIPFGPYPVTISSLANRHVEYETNELIDQLPYSLEVDRGYAMPFDRTLMEYLEAMENDPEDTTRLVEEIAEEDRPLLYSPEEGARETKSKKPSVTWLRRSEYIAEDARTVTSRRQAVEHRFAMSGEKASTEWKTAYATQQGRVEGVKQTFQQPNLATLRHPRKGVKAKRIIPILPDINTQNNIYTVAQFSENPANEKRLNKRKRESRNTDIEEEGSANSNLKHLAQSAKDATDRGILRPITNPHDPTDSYLIWFLPDEDSTTKLVKQKTNPDYRITDKPLRFEAVRDYTYTNDTTGTQHLLITFRGDDQGNKYAYYDVVRSRMMVRKKRAVSRAMRHLDDYEKPNVLNVKFSAG